jgi:hypothetical protein
LAVARNVFLFLVLDDELLGLLLELLDCEIDPVHNILRKK